MNRVSVSVYVTQAVYSNNCSVHQASLLLIFYLHNASVTLYTQRHSNPHHYKDVDEEEQEIRLEVPQVRLADAMAGPRTMVYRVLRQSVSNNLYYTLHTHGRVPGCTRRSPCSGTRPSAGTPSTSRTESDRSPGPWREACPAAWC